MSLGRRDSHFRLPESNTPWSRPSRAPPSRPHRPSRAPRLELAGGRRGRYPPRSPPSTLTPVLTSPASVPSESEELPPKDQSHPPQTVDTKTPACRKWVITFHYNGAPLCLYRSFPPKWSQEEWASGVRGVGVGRDKWSQRSGGGTRQQGEPETLSWFASPPRPRRPSSPSDPWSESRRADQSGLGQG